MIEILVCIGLLIVINGIVLIFKMIIELIKFPFELIRKIRGINKPKNYGRTLEIEIINPNCWDDLEMEWDLDELHLLV